MRRYEAVCSSDVLDEIKSGESVFLFNKAINDVKLVNKMTVDSLVKVFKHDRYEFYKEVEINE